MQNVARVWYCNNYEIPHTKIVKVNYLGLLFSIYLEMKCRPTNQCYFQVSRLYNEQIIYTYKPVNTDWVTVANNIFIGVNSPCSRVTWDNIGARRTPRN
jgi:hypothetical protein